MPQTTPRGTYLTVANALRQKIKGMQPSQRLPSESDLAEQHGVSRGTMRRALKTLADEDLIYPAHGVGWKKIGEGTDRRPLTERISEAVRTDRLKAGDPLPTEKQLCERLSASRTAVRRALAQLEGEGRVKSAPGKRRILLTP